MPGGIGAEQIASIGLYQAVPAGDVRLSLKPAIDSPDLHPCAEVIGDLRGLIEQWNRYLAAVSLHESGHDRIAVQAGYELQAALLAMPAFPSS